jgi:hypothetical protein
MARAAACMSVGLLAIVVAACGASAQTGTSSASRPADPPHATSALSIAASSAAGPPCGPAAAETLAKTVGLVATRIYERELASTGVSADKRQVEGDARLLGALASGSPGAVKEAVTRLVYSGTHIVRLRVTQNGVVLADVGGPYILAPVGGNLRLNGRSVGRYLLSVQDDLGYVKLESRFVGIPLVLHTGSQRIPLEGTLAPGPATIPDHGPVTYRGVHYEAFSFNAMAFPSGRLRISLLVRLPGSLSVGSCAEVKIAALGHIAERLWRRFALAGAPPSAFVHSVESLIGGLAYVRSGSRQLAGSSHLGPGPRRLPDSGTVKYRGVTYGVSSFTATSAGTPVRVYLLAVP